MSKTIELQIAKSAALILGLRNNISELADKGITASQLNAMDTTLDELRRLNSECDALRAQLSERVKCMNRVLQEVKGAFAEKKKTVKGCYPQEQWGRFGVLDKR
ncbi:MAG: hypothetical protein ACI350_03810 [Prevotella sp.]